MAFVRNNFENMSASFTPNGANWNYRAGSDVAATVVASAYFNMVNQIIAAGQLIYCVCSDKTIYTRVTSATGVTPVTTSEWVPT